MQVRNLKLASKREQEQLLSAAAHSPKYRLIILLMLDGGLRVTEVVKLKVGDFDFAAQLVNVASLKKKSENPIYRQVPLSYRTYEALTNYLGDRMLVKDRWLFESNTEVGHLQRAGIWRWIKRHSGMAVSPHNLRHTYGTRVARASGIEQAQKLLGHSSRETTEHYLHVPLIELQETVKKIEEVTWFEKWKRKFKRQKRLELSGNYLGKITGIIGRRKELQRLNLAMEKSINTYVVGEMGIGKSRLLDALEGDRILRLDDMKQVKLTLVSLLKHLESNCNKKHVIEGVSGKVMSDNFVTKASTKRLVELICASVDKNEFTLIIDDLSHLTKSAVPHLEKLKDKFHMIVAARNIKIEYSSFMSNFERLELGKMSRDNCTNMIYQLSKNIRNRIEDYEAYRNYVYSKSSGNPLHLRELIERLAKEQYIGYDVLHSVSHLNSRKQLDFSFPIVLMLSSLMVLRYFGGEIGMDSGAYKLFGGIFLVVCLFARQFLLLTKRKYI